MECVHFVGLDYSIDWESILDECLDWDGLILIYGFGYHSASFLDKFWIGLFSKVLYHVNLFIFSFSL